MNWVRMYVRSVGLLALGLLAMGLSLLLAGCGMPGTPLAPSLNLAVPVKDLAAIRAGNQVRLTWTMPKKNTDKLLLKGDQLVRVCRKERAGEPCSAVKDLHLAPDAASEFSDTLPDALTAGAPRALSYFVEIKNRNGRSAGLSNGAMVLAGEAPAPVTGLEADVRKEGVVLRWTPVAHEQSGMAMRLIRRLLTPAPAKKDSAKNGVLAPPPEATEQTLLADLSGRILNRVLDKSIHFGQTYEYRAQRVAHVTVDGKTQELDGPVSAPIQVSVLDVFPPDMPTGLAAIAVAAENGGGPAIDLSWQPNTESDLAGYIVYRREESAAWMRVSPAQPLPGPGFHDAHVQAGHSYTYSVSAIDAGGHESSRSAEAEETVPGS